MKKGWISSVKLLSTGRVWIGLVWYIQNIQDQIHFKMRILELTIEKEKRVVLVVVVVMGSDVVDGRGRGGCGMWRQWWWWQSRWCHHFVLLLPVLEQ